MFYPCCVFVQFMIIPPPLYALSQSLDIFPGQNDLRCAYVVRSVLLKSRVRIPAKEFRCHLSDECL